MMKYSKKPQPIERIVDILRRFYAFERLHVNEMAQHYEVNSRTIRRDLRKIMNAGIPLLSKRGEYRIDTSQLSRMSRLPSALLHAFASNAGLSIECLGSGSGEGIPLISFAIAYSGIDRQIAESIIESIEKGCKCRFVYTNNRNITTTKTVSPVKLYTAKGKWYLLAKEDTSAQVRPFDFLKIRDFSLLANTPQDLTSEEIAKANRRASIWSSDDAKPFVVRIYASAYATRYLKEVPLHPSQQLDMPHNDGTAEFLYTITHPMELLPEVKNWLPHLHIIEPKLLRDSLREDVEQFLSEMSEIDK